MAKEAGTLVPGYARHVYDANSFSSRIHRLPHLDLELTERCNNNCRHCYINLPAQDPIAQKKEMDTPFILGIIKQAADLGCLDLRLTGGEPLLREDFLEIYFFARKNGFKVLLSTNARRITSEMVRMFKKIPPGQPIGITVYGMSRVSYDRISGVSGAYEEFRRGIGLLQENHVDFALRMAVLPENREEVPAYVAWLAALFAGRQKPVYVADFYKRARHDAPESDRRTEKLRYRPEELVNLLSQTDYYNKEMREFCRLFSGRQGDRIFTCGFGRALCVDAYGFAQGCLLLRHPDLLFDLRTGTLAEALHAFFPQFRNRRAQHPLFLSRCARCCLRGLCKQCPAQSWMEHGTLDTPVDFQCRVAHAHARKLGLLAADENGWELDDWPERQVKLNMGAV